jgi:hypothetical protein
MLFQQPVNKMCPQLACSKLVKLVETMLFQQVVKKMFPQQACSKLVNEL